MTMEKLISRIVMIWMLIIMITISSLYKHMNETGLNFYRFGPHDNFIVIGIKINTPYKYFLVILYCFINSLLRNTVHNILNPWLINSVQDLNVIKPKQIKCFAYEVTYVVTIYNWVDWYVYMNLLLAQIDMIITETLADMMMSGFVTHYYLTYEKKNPENETISEQINPMILDEELETELELV